MSTTSPPRKPGTRADGLPFSLAERQLVFNKARPAPGHDPMRYRLDSCGALMDLHAYGDTTPRGHGWEIDHIHPVSRGGSSTLANLQPLQWQNNRAKGDSLPGTWACVIRM